MPARPPHIRSTSSIERFTLSRLLTRAAALDLTASGYLAALVHNDLIALPNLKPLEPAIREDRVYDLADLMFSLPVHLYKPSKARARRLRMPSYSIYLETLIRAELAYAPGPLVLLSNPTKK